MSRNSNRSPTARRWTKFIYEGRNTDYKVNNIVMTIGRFCIVVILIFLHYSEAATQASAGIENSEKSANKESNRYVKPLYKFGYSVYDPYTLDIKSQWEHRDGDAVWGSYSFLDADGMIRIVEYTADGDYGFRANVKKIRPHQDSLQQLLTSRQRQRQYVHQRPSYSKVHNNNNKNIINYNNRNHNYLVPTSGYHPQYYEHFIPPPTPITYIYKTPTSITANKYQNFQQPNIPASRTSNNKNTINNNHNEKKKDHDYNNHSNHRIINNIDFSEQPNTRGMQSESGFYKKERKSSKYETKTRTYNEYDASPR